jgi:hypothetical protein
MKPLRVLGLLLPVLAATAWLCWPRAPRPATGMPAMAVDAPEASGSEDRPAAAGAAPALAGHADSSARARIAASAPAECEWELAMASVAMEGAASAPPPAGTPPEFDASSDCRLAGRIVAHGARATLALRSGMDAGRRVEVGEDGTFEIHGLAPGRVVVRIEAGPQVAERMVELSAAGSDPEWLELDFAATGSALVRVFDHLGNPVEGASLRLDGGEARTDADGRARLERAPLGRAWCEAIHGEHARRGFALQVVPESSTQVEERVELAPGSHVEIAVEGDFGDARLAVVVVPTVAKGGPSEAQLSVPWWTFEPLQLARGDRHWLGQLPSGRHIVVPYLDGVRQRGKHAIVDLPVGRLRVARLVLERPACDPLAGGPSCEGADRLAWRALDRWKKSAEDYELEAHSAGRLGLPASIGVAGVVRSDGSGRWCAPRHLLERGASLGWVACGERASTGLVLGPGLEPFGAPRPAAASGLVLQLPRELGDAWVRLRVDGAVRGALQVPPDGRLELPGLRGLWRARLAGGTPATTRTTMASSASASPALFAGGGDGD